MSHEKRDKDLNSHLIIDRSGALFEPTRCGQGGRTIFFDPFEPGTGTQGLATKMAGEMLGEPEKGGDFWEQAGRRVTGEIGE